MSGAVLFDEEVFVERGDDKQTEERPLYALAPLGPLQRLRWPQPRPLLEDCMLAGDFRNLPACQSSI
jgi:hypothetical protein